ncbi:MAG: Cell division protein FtsL [Alphaproteobacteria bacterium MarineAlpha6_Bin2]|jgi:cell division protein FtsL|nr:MAG: Cell division protein FtsL [Alphaproteobacteria bacterium MarineAlpha6_Bin2]
MILANKKNQTLLILLFVFCFSLIFVSGVRDNLKNIDKDLVKMKYEIEKEKDLIKILKADYTNLTKPSRIVNLAKEKLGLDNIKSFQIKKLSDFY